MQGGLEVQSQLQPTEDQAPPWAAKLLAQGAETSRVQQDILHRLDAATSRYDGLLEQHNTQL